jgi:GH24 family phage-related lysozyme (muramidase)
MIRYSFIQDLYRYRAERSLDGVGRSVIGYGHRGPLEPKTANQAGKFLELDVKEAWHDIKKAYPDHRLLDDCAKTALASRVFDLGVNEFISGGVLSCLNDGVFDILATYRLRADEPINSINCKAINRRRVAEADLFSRSSLCRRRLRAT